MLYKWEIEGFGAETERSILETLIVRIMFFKLKTYDKSTARRVRLKLGNNTLMYVRR